MTDCKSPTHKRYRDALEGLYIHTYLASQDLDKIRSVAEGTNALEKGRAIDARWQEVVAAADRISFARTSLDDAEREVNAHLERGCRNLAPVASSGVIMCVRCNAPAIDCEHSPYRVTESEKRALWGDR